MNHGVLYLFYIEKAVRKSGQSDLHLPTKWSMVYSRFFVHAFIL